MKQLLDSIDSLFHPDSPVAATGSRIFSLVGLNLLWLVCSLPIVTLGPATIAMHHVLFQYHSGRSDQVWKPFFHAFRRDFLAGLVLGLPATLLLLLLSFNGLYLAGSISEGFTPLWIAFILGVAFWLGLIIYGFPLAARYTLSFSQVIHNSVAFLLRFPKFSILSGLGYLAPLLLWLLLPGLWQKVSFFWVLIGPAAVANICDKRLLPLFESQQTENA